MSTPYDRAKAIWDSRMGNAVKQIHTWKVVTILFAFLLTISVFGNIYLGQRKQNIPYVIEIGRNGETTALSPHEGLSKKSLKRVMSFFLSRFVMLAREIPSDAVLLRENMHRLFQQVSNQGKSLLSAKFQETSPSEEFHRMNRTVKITSVLEVSKDIYQVDWFEAEYDKGGQKLAEYPMRGSFKIATLEPKNDTQIKENPLGIFIDYFSWTRLGGR